jgi:hypothetical protein
MQPSIAHTLLLLVPFVAAAQGGDKGGITDEAKRLFGDPVAKAKNMSQCQARCAFATSVVIGIEKNGENCSLGLDCSCRNDGAEWEDRAKDCPNNRKMATSNGITCSENDYELGNPKDICEALEDSRDKADNTLEALFRVSQNAVTEKEDGTAGGQSRSAVVSFATVCKVSAGVLVAVAGFAVTML